MSELFKGIPKREVTPDPDAQPSPLPPGALASGSYWTLFERPESFVVEYVSGEIAGRARSVRVSAEEADQLKTADDDRAAAIINAHGGG